MNRFSLPGALGALAIVMTVATPGLAVAQEAGPRQDTLASLLVEVRALRTSLEQLAAAGPRVQLAMGRLQIQEQRVTAARRHLDDLREGIATGEHELRELRDRVPMMEEVAARLEGPERDEAAASVKYAKLAAAQKAADVQRLREQEVELAGVVATEEGRWTEISQRLDDLERALTPRR
jgi:hypothetical protein